MPTYDYRCEACGHEMVVFQGITEEALRECPHCHAQELRRLIGTGGGIIFKGSGFYETDYKRARNPKAGAGKDSESKPEKKESSNDSKTSDDP